MTAMTDWPLKVIALWLMATVLTSLLSAAAYPVAARWMAQLTPALRARLRLAYALSAPACALLAVVLVSRPELAGLLIPAHCHGQQCTAHLPMYPGESPLLSSLAIAGSLSALLTLVVLLWALRRSHRQAKLLRAFARRSTGGFQLLDSDDLLACCVGLWRPKIVLSRGLVDQLNPDELRIVLAHERAHMARNDNVCALLLRWATLFWPAALGQRIGTDMHADAEQACDIAAARAVASPARVAAVVNKLARLSARTSAVSPAADALDRDARGRLRTLADARCTARSSLSGWLQASACLSLSWCIQVPLLTSLSHPAIEWLGALAA